MSVLSWDAWQAQLAPRSTNQSTHLNDAIFMSHSTSCRICSSHRPYLHAAGASLRRPKYSIKRFNLHVAFALHVMGVEFRPSSSSHAYDKQVAPPARSTGHQLSTPSTALFMVHARKARMGIDALYVLSWHHGTGTYSSLFSSKGFTKIYLNCFILEPICYYIYTYGYIVNMGASWSMES